MREMETICEQLHNERKHGGDIILLVFEWFWSGDDEEGERIVRAFGNAERLEEFRQHRNDRDLAQMRVRLQSVEH